MRRDRILLIGLFFSGIVIHVPFTNQAFNIDDPLNIYLARHILKESFNPYNFSLVYSGIVQQFYRIYTNPPLNGYLLALPIFVFQENEIALRACCLFYPFIIAAAMFFLARKFLGKTKDALIASVILFISPGVFVTSHTIMPDVPLLCFYLWAIYFYAAADREKTYYFYLSGLCASAACMTRYSGLTLIPILFVFFLGKKGARHPSGIAALLVPVVTFVIWKKYTVLLYGPEYWGSMVSFQSDGINFHKILMHLLANFSYLGGAVIFAPMFLAALWVRRRLINIAVILVALCFTITLAFYLRRNYEHNMAQLLLFSAITFPLASFLTLSASCFIGGFLDRGKLIILLFWIALIMVFHSFLQHATVKYSILAAPAVILLFMMMLKKAIPKYYFSVSVICAILTAVLAFAIAVGDMNFADSYRDFAGVYYPKYKNENNKVFYVGDWGFNYYMRRAGAIPIQKDSNNGERRGDILFIPASPWPQPIPGDMENNVRMLETVTTNSSFPVYTMNGKAKAFFWANYNFPKCQGLLPFSFGVKIPIEEFYIYEVL